jgi:hypothetical protein
MPQRITALTARLIHMLEEEYKRKITSSRIQGVGEVYFHKNFSNPH